MRRRSRTHYAPVAASFIFLSVYAIALAADSFPKGYLVPTPTSIPQGLKQVERPYSPYSNDSYVLEYRATDNQGMLAITENPGDANKLMQGSEMLVQQSKKGHSMEKIRDIDYMGAHGALYHRDTRGISGYDLVMDDNNKVLRIQAQDGPKFHFTDDMVMNVLRGMTRQN